MTMRRGIFCGFVAGLVGVVLMAGVPAEAAGTPHLLVVSVPRGQSLQDLANDRFVERVTCRRTCKTTTKVLISANFIDRHAKPGKLIVIGSASARLKARQTAKVAIRLNKVGTTALKHIGSAEVLGRVDAVSTVNRSDAGSGIWSVTLRRH